MKFHSFFSSCYSLPLVDTHELSADLCAHRKWIKFGNNVDVPRWHQFPVIFRMDRRHGEANRKREQGSQLRQSFCLPEHHPANQVEVSGKEGMMDFAFLLTSSILDERIVKRPNHNRVCGCNSLGSSVISDAPSSTERAHKVQSVSFPSGRS